MDKKRRKLSTKKKDIHKEFQAECQKSPNRKLAQTEAKLQLDEEPSDSTIDIHSLPEEIMIKIFRYFKQKKLGEFARVCRRWSELTRSPVLWKTVNMDFSPARRSQTAVATSFINTLPFCVTQIRLDFRSRHSWTEHLNFEDLSVRLKEKCPHLKLLSLNHAKLSDTLPSVIDLCTLFLPSVIGLIISYSQFPDSPSRGECGGFSKIKLLAINFCPLGRINKPKFSRMPYLKHLRLRDSKMADFWLEGDASFLNKLHVLDLAHSCISSRTFQTIRNQGRNLKKLYVCGAHLVDRDFNFNNSMLPHLETICLKHCHRVTDEGIVHLILACQSLQNVYVDKRVAESFAEHPFVTANRYMLEMVKDIGFCHSHLKNVFMPVTYVKTFLPVSSGVVLENKGGKGNLK